MIEFTKMHGLGNDFVMLDGTNRPNLTPDDIQSLCDRRRGVGADGVIIVTPVAHDVIRMEYWNADGSPSEMCGNGLRCSAWFGYQRGWVADPELTVETARGPLGARIVGDESVRVELGDVVVGERLRVGDVDLTTASVGNPHAVVGVDSVDTAPVGTLGPTLATDVAFAQGTNVEFMSITGAGIDLRVWERGVGETLACGSGAAAAAAVAIQSGRATSPVAVRLPGGVLQVEVQDGRAYLTGPVATVYSGVIGP